MQSAKNAVLALVGKLPDDATYDDILEEIYFQQSLEEGLLQVEKGEVVSYEYVKGWLKSWLK